MDGEIDDVVTTPAMMDDAPGDSTDVLVAGDQDYEVFDRPPGEGDVVGDPWTSSEAWEMQERSDSCAVVAQGYVIELITGHEIPEDELVAVADEKGWYVDGGGTPALDVGKLLDHYGFPVDQRYDATVEDLETALADGEYVIAGVDSSVVWDTDGDSWWSVFQIDSADHAVQVTGIDRTDPDEPMVILNDPGHSQGDGMLVPMDRFTEAWEDTGGFMVTTAGNAG